MKENLYNNFKLSPACFCDLVWWLSQHTVLVSVTLMQLEMNLK